MDTELRLRELEKEQQQLAPTISYITQALEEIKDKLDSMSTQDELQKLETTAISAHRRIDELSKELWKIQTEHAACAKIRDDTARALMDNSQLMTDLRIELKEIQGTIKTLQKHEDTVKSFFASRLGAVMDKILTTVLPWALLVLWLNYKLGPKVSAAVKVP